MAESDDPSTERRLLAALGEFDALRAEIEQRSTAQGQLVAGAVTLTGLAAAAGLVRDGWAVAALVLPSICAVLGLMWNDHAVQIEKIGTYIEYVLAPEVRDANRAPLGLSWEAVAKVNPAGAPKALARLGVPILAMALVPTFPALALSWSQVDSIGEWFLVVMSAALEGTFIASWLSMIGPLGNASQREALARQMQQVIDEERGRSG